MNRVPERTALIFYGVEYTYKQMLALVERLSGHFQKNLSLGMVSVLLYAKQPSIYNFLHAILMQGVVVPINPMSKDAEVAFIQSDTNARLLFCGSEVCEYALPLLLRGNLEHIVVTNYDDMCDLHDLKLPASVVARDPEVMRKRV